MTTVVITENSMYEIDQERGRIRVESTRLPTPNEHRVTPDADGWRPYSLVTIEGDGLLIVWGRQGTVIRRTYTSAIVQIEGDDIPTSQEMRERLRASPEATVE